jgi:hypothetical protein
MVQKGAEMNLQYIQTEIFRELVGMETLLKPEYRFHLIRDTDGALAVYLVYKPNPMKYVEFPYIVVRDLTTPDQITAEINRIWQEIPAECKKDPLK